MKWLYSFVNYPVDKKLYLEMWLQHENGETEYMWSLPVDNIAHGFSVIEKYKRNGNTMIAG